jgi:DNA-binding transcriptional ArsR family regulator
MRKPSPRLTPDRLSRTFAALADPTRRAILARLTSGQSSVTELARPHAMSLPAISKHLRVLERSGLIERSRSAQWRPCRLKAEPMKEAVDWLEHYRRHWEESFDRLEAYLKELQSAKPKRRKIRTKQNHEPQPDHR